ncbi:MAG: peptide chain release factor N(5)-glutamine methyltransferase, partial [Armatimonadetes bacterium]|nr:peptide chain release factor N(5)-glutamine methyltransferase [Armatimonadota bacterium]
FNEDFCPGEARGEERRLTAAQAVEEGVRRLRDAGIDSSRLDAELLLCRALGWDRTRLYTYPEQPLSPEAEAEWRALLQRRAWREPLPYLLGEWEFYGRPFLVSPAVLIPRPETELLVEGLLGRRPWSAGAPPCFVDVGTGSGCIALTLAAEVPEAIGVMLDSSAAALEVARANADRLGVGDRVKTRHAAFPDGLEDLAGRVDLLVSNPPYVAAADRATLPPEVREYEPEEALYAGPEGLTLLHALLDRGRALLRPGGWIALEFGIGQADALREMADGFGYVSLSIEPDLAGIPRALFARTPE